MDDKQFRELTQKLETLIKLTAMNSVAGKGLTEQITTLNSVGLKPAEIAEILGKPLNSVTGIISRLKRREGEKKSD